MPSRYSTQWDAAEVRAGQIDRIARRHQVAASLIWHRASEGSEGRQTDECKSPSTHAVVRFQAGDVQHVQPVVAQNQSLPLPPVRIPAVVSNVTISRVVIDCSAVFFVGTKFVRILPRAIGGRVYECYRAIEDQVVTEAAVYQVGARGRRSGRCRPPSTVSLPSPAGITSLPAPP